MNKIERQIEALSIVIDDCWYADDKHTRDTLTELKRELEGKSYQETNFYRVHARSNIKVLIRKLLGQPYFLQWVGDIECKRPNVNDSVD